MWRLIQDIKNTLDMRQRDGQPIEPFGLSMKRVTFQKRSAKRKETPAITNDNICCENKVKLSVCVLFFLTINCIKKFQIYYVTALCK